MQKKSDFFLKKRMKESFAYGLEFMLTLAKMQNNSTLKWTKFDICDWSFLKLIQAFHTVHIFCISSVLVQWSGRWLQHIDFILKIDYWARTPDIQNYANSMKTLLSILTSHIIMNEHELRQCLMTGMKTVLWRNLVIKRPILGVLSVWMSHRVWSISPTLFEVGIRNSVCGCILGLWSFAYRFGLSVTL